MNAAVVGVISFLGNMSVCDGTEKVNVTEKVHGLLLSGVFFGKFSVLVRAQIGFNQEYGCVMKLSVRALDSEVSASVLQLFDEITN
jgi:coatomer protein complex subunit gamma